VVAIRLLCGALLLVFAGTTAGQKSKPKLPDEVPLRAQFVAAFGNDFNLVKSEFKTRANARGGGTYWLAYLEPKRTGYFYLEHRYQDSDPLYSHVEQEIHLGVGPKGCHRGAPYAGTYSRFCLGDTIIFPMLINNFTEHEFKLVKAKYSNGDQDWETFADLHPESSDQALDQTPLANNPAAESLRYIGRRSHKMLHRSPGYTLEWYAEFEAAKPGRFILEVSAASRDPSPGVASALAVSGGVPIIVVARDAPVTMIAGHEEVRGYRMGYDGREYVSSTSGNSYMTNLMILQPGDRISLRYFSAVRRQEFFGERSSGSEQSDRVDDVKPLIRKHPFSLNADYDFNEWLIGYLPK
jgi:hypothetical protein